METRATVRVIAHIGTSFSGVVVDSFICNNHNTNCYIVWHKLCVYTIADMVIGIFNVHLVGN